MQTMQVDVVGAEELIDSGEATFVALPGEVGELGIYPRHTPLISRIKAGSVRIQKPDGEEEFVFVAGGILEIQPNGVTVLSDTAVRGADLDEERANALLAGLNIQILPYYAASLEPHHGDVVNASLKASVMELISTGEING